MYPAIQAASPSPGLLVKQTRTCAEVPGAGLEPARPYGAPDFKSGASGQFRHPGGTRLTAGLEALGRNPLRALEPVGVAERLERVLVEAGALRENPL
jgi:hypothetical protein